MHVCVINVQVEADRKFSLVCAQLGKEMSSITVKSPTGKGKISFTLVLFTKWQKELEMINSQEIKIRAEEDRTEVRIILLLNKKEMQQSCDNSTSSKCIAVIVTLLKFTEIARFWLYCHCVPQHTHLSEK